MFNRDIQLCDDVFPPMESCKELRSPSQSYGIDFPLKGFSHGQSSFPARRNQNIFFTMPDQTSSSNMFNSNVTSSRPMQRQKKSCSYERSVSPIVTEPSSQPTSPKFPATIESIKHCFRRNGKEDRSISDLAVFRNDIICNGWQSFQSIPPPDQLRKKKSRRQPVWARSLGKDVEDHIHLVKKKNAELLQSTQEIGYMMNNFVPIYAEAHRNDINGTKRPIENILAPRKRVFLNPVNPFFKSAYDDSP